VQLQREALGNNSRWQALIDEKARYSQAFGYSSFRAFVNI